MPYYNFEDLRIACTGPEAALRVFVSRDAESDAGRIFHLRPKTEILSFIARGALEDLKFQNTEPWRSNPTQSLVMVDAYGFRTGTIYGYIAFLQRPNKTDVRWLIKSFKENNLIPDEGSYNSLDQGQALQKALGGMRWIGGSCGNALPYLRNGRAD